MSVVVTQLFNFNSHAHVERDQRFLPYRSAVAYFNSHAHVERDAMSFYPSFLPEISTHTLTWSVTDKRKKFLY